MNSLAGSAIWPLRLPRALNESRRPNVSGSNAAAGRTCLAPADGHRPKVAPMPLQAEGVWHQFRQHQSRAENAWHQSRPAPKPGRRCLAPKAGRRCLAPKAGTKASAPKPLAQQHPAWQPGCPALQSPRSARTRSASRRAFSSQTKLPFSSTAIRTVSKVSPAAILARMRLDSSGSRVCVRMWSMLRAPESPAAQRSASASTRASS